MITKERLEELIKQGATIYKISRETFIAGVSDLLKIDEIPSGLYSQEISDRIGQEPDYDLLFETEEDARWEIEMTATRPETLKLPTWKEFKSQERQISFFTYPYYYACYTDLINIGITEYYGIGGKEIFSKPLTKENYIEACELCKKLFLGEGV